ncbi:hypothetical protein T492DRAFT_293634 [Pavlovales sp. CCMP2436]|nr:hypothetical protein T492DRAFT_293634 [Pavlovales sp. CCMP2436]
MDRDCHLGCAQWASQLRGRLGYSSVLVARWSYLLRDGRICCSMVRLGCAYWIAIDLAAAVLSTSLTVCVVLVRFPRCTLGHVRFPRVCCSCPLPPMHVGSCPLPPMYVGSCPLFQWLSTMSAFLMHCTPCPLSRCTLGHVRFSNRCLQCPLPRCTLGHVRFPDALYSTSAFPMLPRCCPKKHLKAPKSQTRASRAVGQALI